MREQLASIWKNLEEYICCALLGVIMTLLMMQVCYRYFGGKSIAWSEEVSRFLFLYLVYFAASLAASKNLHIRVTAQLKLLPKLGQMLLLLTTDIIWLVFCIIVVDVGTDFIISMSDRPMVSGALMLDMRYVYAAVPIAFTLQAVRLVERWWRIFTKRDPLSRSQRGGILMSLEVLIWIALAVLLVMGTPIFVSLGMASITVLLLSDIPLSLVMIDLIKVSDMFPLLAVVGFVFAGALMERGGMAARSLRSPPCSSACTDCP